MATEEYEQIRTVYLTGMTAAHVFREAADWVARNDAVRIDGVRWAKNPLDEYELAIYYEDPVAAEDE